MFTEAGEWSLYSTLGFLPNQALCILYNQTVFCLFGECQLENETDLVKERQIVK